MTGSSLLTPPNINAQLSGETMQNTYIDVRLP